MEKRVVGWVKAYKWFQVGQCPLSEYTNRQRLIANLLSYAKPLACVCVCVYVQGIGRLLTLASKDTSFTRPLKKTLAFQRQSKPQGP